MTKDPRSWIQDPGYESRILDTRTRILDAKTWILDTRTRILDTRTRILDTGCEGGQGGECRPSRWKPKVLNKKVSL